MRSITVLVLTLCVLGCTPAADGEPVAAASPTPVLSMAPTPPPPGGGLTGTVLETFDSGGYTYFRLAKGEREIWAAVTEAAVEVGSQVTIGGAMLMEDFESPSLGRTFDEIYFGTLVAGAAPAAEGDPAPAEPVAAAPAAPADAEVAKSEAENGRTVAEIYAGKAELSGQPVSVRGKVVKYNSGIMGRNWIHLQDGSGVEGDGTNDLTVTTQDEASVGEIVVIEGTLVLDKDFGAGYSYAVIVEEASVSR